MIGLFGIIAHERILDKQKRDRAFSRMAEDTDHEDFVMEVLSGRHYSIGLIKRANGENKDLAMRAIGDKFFCAFCGYGKFKGEKRLYWAEDMLDRAAEAFQEEGEEAFKLIEGSFQCFIIRGTELIILNDRFSSKTLYYYDNEKVLIFAPDVGSIVSSGLIDKNKNVEAIVQLLMAGFFLDESTLVKSVFRLAGASLLTKDIMKKEKAKIKTYWKVSSTKKTINEVTPTLIDEFSNLIKRATYEMAALSESFIVPLSGGLDSRAIACFLSDKYHIKTITYDTITEATIASQVCKRLNAESNYFSNDRLIQNDYRHAIFKVAMDQKIHAVINQYMYSPLFKNYFHENKGRNAVFDGIYLDMLFSEPAKESSFRFASFFKYRGGSSIQLLARISNTRDSYMLSLLKTIHERFLGELDGFTGFQAWEWCYLKSRLSRYVIEALHAKENYCYIFKPGFDYDLMDFAHSLSMRLRAGELYLQMLKARYPEVMKISFKDSYGIRKKRFDELLGDFYIKQRLRLSNFTNGIIKYYPYQIDYFFHTNREFDKWKKIFVKRNYLQEFFNDEQLINIFEMSKKKQWMFNYFQRILFVQMFFSKYKIG